MHFNLYLFNHFNFARMKKLFFISIVFISANAIGQKTHKATDDKPYASDKYVDYQGNDSVHNATTLYAYNSNKQVVTEIVTNRSNGDMDSIIKNYDLNNRIISENIFLNDTLYCSKTWVYDEISNQVDYHEKRKEEGDLDTIIHIVYKGVQNFDKIDANFSSIFSFFMETQLEFRACDTMFVYYKDSSSWKLALKVLSKQNQEEEIISVDVGVNLAMLDEFVELVEDLFTSAGFSGTTVTKVSLKLTPTYSPVNSKLTRINGDLHMETNIPFIQGDFLFLTLGNQYDDEFLTETLIEMKVGTVMGYPVNQYFGGIKQKYVYNIDENLACITEDNSSNGSRWDINYKTYFHYDNTSNVTAVNIANITLNQNIPNPSNDLAVIKYNVPVDSKIQFTIYDISGRTLIAQQEEAKSGENIVKLSVSHLPAGMYFYSMEFEGMKMTKAMSICR